MSERMNEKTGGESGETGWENVDDFAPDAEKVKDSRYMEGYHPYGLDVVDLNRIDLGTQEGRYDFALSLAENRVAVYTERMKAVEEEDFDKIRDEESVKYNGQADFVIEDEVKAELEMAEIEKTIMENLDFSEASVIQALQKKFDEYAKKSAAEGVSERARERFYKMSRAADNLRATLVAEVRERKEASKRQAA
ncbi:hypothetical protein FWH13_00430 [Candidatus Saccharibacteria bacterium]|nr:hypothetical protein [Candidatus Saccharibacteria bacterium]